MGESDVMVLLIIWDWVQVGILWIKKIIKKKIFIKDDLLTSSTKINHANIICIDAMMNKNIFKLFIFKLFL